MKTLVAAPLILSLLAAPLAAQQAAAPPPPAAAPSVAAFLPNTQALFDAYVRDDKMPGIVGAFGVGDHPTLFPAAGRIADDANAPRADADTLWRVYSMTKPVTAMAAMILVEDGKLRLDQPISDFFPGFAKMRVLTRPDASLDSVPAKTPITVRHLLTHTAGLGYSIITKGPLLKEYERLGIVPFASNATVEAQVRPTRPRTLQEFAARVATLPLIAEPGTKWSYSIGLDVLAAVVEKASGMPFERFVQARLFTPLGMTSSYWTVPASAAPRLATNYVFTGDVRSPIDPGATSAWLSPPSFPYGGAGLVMSARDYDRFLHMLLDGGTLEGARVMKPETVRLAMSNLLPADVTFGGVDGGTGGTNAAVPMGFGAGGSVYLADGPGGFPGKGTYGWGGAAGTVAWVDPVHKVRGTIMVNYFPSDRYPLRQAVVAALMKDSMRLHGTPTGPR
ncbi:serine hydrolase [Sphingomonas metalli]|uniref:Serine hydrolase n=1 Tax=Sphingomonas metalli TaxID=1779358 RepID=A0A916T398_9SPHN|nr:serine hydrolase domain-containing protein [Sphingomonas metalli]GGB28616.1 serine hydrolase [Sphingomonas metalli]